MPDYPEMITPIHHVEPVPRRIRGIAGGETVLDTTAALYVWEHPYYPQYYVPRADVLAHLLVPEGAGATETDALGTIEPHGLQVNTGYRAQAAKVIANSPIAALGGTVRFDWGAMDAWFEEDEQVFVHPRNPYVRVDALRSTRSVRVELEGVVLAQSSSPVMVFETGLPTRYYLNRMEIDFTDLISSDTATACPYKGETSEYWSLRSGERIHRDLAWSYNFPTSQLALIGGLVAFYNERVDLFVDGHKLDRPRTHFSDSGS